MPIPGAHNALNALAAIAVAAEAGLPDAQIRDALGRFSGVKRRFQKTGTVDGVSVFDDYGHHPIEIRSVLSAARAGAVGRVIAVVEPHRYSRVRDLFQDFCNCLVDADHVFVIPLYSAGEQPIDGISSQSLVSGIQASGHRSVASVTSLTELAGKLKRMAKPGDTVVWEPKRNFSRIKKLVKIGSDTSGEIIREDAESVEGTKNFRLIIPEDAKRPSPREKYYIIFIDNKGDTIKIDPHLIIPPGPGTLGDDLP